MKRLRLTVAVIAVVAAACGGTTDGRFEVAPVTPTQSEQSPSVTAAPETSVSTQAPLEGPATTEVPAPPKTVDGPAAPDFTLALADGRGDFVLSAEQKPVFMVFWAEW